LFLSTDDLIGIAYIFLTKNQQFIPESSSRDFEQSGRAVQKRRPAESRYFIFKINNLKSDENLTTHAYVLYQKNYKKQQILAPQK